jgi:hypothetical protein
MIKKSLVTLVAAVAAGGSLTTPALASHGGGGKGGGGGSKATLPAPPIPPATFEGIGSGPVYVHESFGHAQRTRYTEKGSIIDVVDKPEIDGIRAEFPNNRTESWFGTETSGAASWRFAVISPGDPYEPFTPLQVNEFGAQDGDLALVGAELGEPDTRPAALLPFAAPADSAYTVSADTVAFIGRTAIGFSSSSATNHNFETNGQAWLELDTTGLSVIGGNTGIVRWTFHTDGLSGPALSGTYHLSPTAYNRAAISYDPVAHVAAATIDGTVVASVPSTSADVRYVGVEGSLNANVDNFTVRAGTVTDQPAT